MAAMYVDGCPCAMLHISDPRGIQWRLRREPNQKRVNGAPPGKAEVGEEGPSQAETKETTTAEPSPTIAEVTKEEGGALLDTTDAAGVAEEGTGESVTEQLQELSLNEPTTEEAETVVEDGEESGAEEEDDGAGEWISSSPTLPPADIC